MIVATEHCESCQTDVIYADRTGRCPSCAALFRALRLMASGVTRDKKTGRFARVGKVQP